MAAAVFTLRPVVVEKATGEKAFAENAANNAEKRIFVITFIVYKEMIGFVYKCNVWAKIVVPMVVLAKPLAEVSLLELTV